MIEKHAGELEGANGRGEERLKEAKEELAALEAAKDAVQNELDDAKKTIEALKVRFWCFLWLFFDCFLAVFGLFYGSLLVFGLIFPLFSSFCPLFPTLF